MNGQESRGIVVYGASSSDIAQEYVDFARSVGREIARRGYTLINGGGRAGLMGASIEGALEAGGEVTGVLPDFMIERGWAHPGLTNMISTASMHERKLTMAESSVGAIALPGSVGTLDELFEILTWRQLGLYRGSVVIANVNGFYDLLLEHLRRTDALHFMRSSGLWTVATTPDGAVAAALEHHRAVTIGEKY